MTPNYFLAKTMQIIKLPSNPNRIAECTECKASMTIPEVFGDHPTEANKAHFFRVLHHAKKCPAFNSYETDLKMEQAKTDDYL